MTMKSGVLTKLSLLQSPVRIKPISAPVAGLPVSVTLPLFARNLGPLIRQLYVPYECVVGAGDDAYHLVGVETRVAHRRAALVQDLALAGAGRRRREFPVQPGRARRPCAEGY